MTEPTKEDGVMDYQGPLFGKVGKKYFHTGWDSKDVDKIVAEIATLRSLTSWHTGVPKESGKYIVEYETGYVNSTTGKFTIASDICFYNAMGGFWVTYYNPIRWAFLPKEGE